MAKLIDLASRRRRAILAGAAILLITIGGIYTSLDERGADAAMRAVDWVRLAAFLILALVLALRSTTSFSFLGRNPVLDDELTRANRASAARVGFWALMLGVIAAYVAAAFEPLNVREVAPLLVALGASAATLRFAILEGRGDG